MIKKAYYVHDGFDAGVLVFAPTSTQARAVGARKLDCFYTDARAKREVWLDRYAESGIVPDGVLHAAGWQCEPEQTPCEACGLYAYPSMPETALQDSGKCQQCESEGES